MERYARLRSANRAMPAAASDMPGAEQRERRATKLRENLSKLAAYKAPADRLKAKLDSYMGALDKELAIIEQDLLERFDAVPFVSLRASVPRSVESHRREVVALLEVLISDRPRLEERLPQVEYLITMLATEEVEGRRNIVHDPLTLTPMLEDFTVEGFDEKAAEAVAMDLYQSATLDSESENFHEILRQLRAKKLSFGLGCLCPAVLRAVVTYNARMFNSVESLNEASRASDAVVEEALSAMLAEDAELEAVEAEEAAETAEAADASETAATDEDADASEAEADVSAKADVEAAQRAVAPSAKPVTVAPKRKAAKKPAPPAEADPKPELISVFDCQGLDLISDAMCNRLAGQTVGRRGAQERVAIVLDMGSLGPVESAAIRTAEPTLEDRIVARTAIVGLMLRDLGPLGKELQELGIDRDQLTDAWVRELNDTFGQLISEKLADPKAYEHTSKLSGIKSKHLLKPLNALKNGRRASGGESTEMMDAASEMQRAARAAAGDSGSPARALGSTARPSASRSSRSSGAGLSLGGGRSKIIAAAALVTLAFGLAVANFIGISPADIKDLGAGSLSDTSPYLQSAYRNEDGRGGLLIGRVDARFDALSQEEKIEAAEEMVENFEFQGIREAMLYDDRGLMQVHFAAGLLHRPREGDRSRGSKAGQGAVRRTLMGKRVDESDSDASEDEDPWAEDDDEEDDDDAWSE